MKKVLKGCGIALAVILVLLIIAGIGIMIFIDRIFPDGSPETLPTAPAAGADSALVETTSGSVRGFIRDEIYTYYGIPYARATERFTPAQEYHWDGVLDAVAYGPIAMQGNTGDNNCQNLNIWTPGVGDGEKRPVMVWLHSGAFSSGSSSGDASTDGTSLATEGDVVVVSLNHRLNVMGFLDLSAYGEKYQYSGNVGLMDIVMALEWVNENIEAFGGDPENVTIFGESGGGAKVLALMTTPYAEGLFHKGINESGILDSSGITFTAQEVSRRVAELTLEKLSVAPENIEELQTIPYSRLTSASDSAMAEAAREYGLELLGQTSMQWLPTIDGDYLPTAPVTEDGFAETGRDIPLMVGTNLAELNGFMAMMTDRSDWDEAETMSQLESAYGDNAQAIADAFASAYPHKALSDALYVDTAHRQPALKLLHHKLMQGGAPVYAYVYTWESPESGGRMLATHGAEIPFVFHNIEYSAMAGTSDEAKALEQAMSRAWLAFAHTGDPGTEELPWPAYDGENGATMIFDNDPYVGFHHDRALLDLLNPGYDYD